MKTILKEEGMLGMWKGLEPNCLRACLVNIGTKINMTHKKIKSIFFNKQKICNILYT